MAFFYACISARTAEICDHAHIGNYYNWTAAIASNDSTAISNRYATTSNSICPKGWRLPTGPDGTNGSEYQLLLQAAHIANSGTSDPGTGDPIDIGFVNGGRTILEAIPYSFARTGSVSDTTLYYFTGNGFYWSGSAVSSSGAFYLIYNSGALYPASHYDRSNGRPLRCLAR
ncbi:hypothetical protein IKG60_00540 [Candidatus Saccharibacteria bacterium]|nr:hypothetical protein [Candidatus Saccharibacteria bacterium]